MLKIIKKISLWTKCKTTVYDTLVIYNVQNVGVLNNVIGDIIMGTIAMKRWVLLVFVSLFQLSCIKCFYVLIVDGTAFIPHDYNLSGSL